MPKDTVTYVRKSDGANVEVFTVGWGPYRHITIHEADGSKFDIPVAQFEQEYKLPEASRFARLFRRGIR